MATQILMPALSPTMEQGTVAKWLVEEGEVVSSGQVIAEIETDKAIMELEAVEEGTISKLLVPAGTEAVAINSPIALLIEEGDDGDTDTETDTGQAGNRDSARSAGQSPGRSPIRPRGVTQGRPTEPALSPHRHARTHRTNRT